MANFAILIWLSFLGSDLELPQESLAGSEKSGVTFSEIAVSAAIHDIKQPCPRRVHYNEATDAPLMYRPHDMQEDCPVAIKLLAKTQEPIDERLLTMARNTRNLPERYRTVLVLIESATRMSCQFLKGWQNRKTLRNGILRGTRIATLSIHES